MSLSREIKEYGLDLGYSRVGITTADDFPEYVDILRSRGDKYDFFANDPRNPIRNAHPREVIPFAKSIIVLIWDYGRTSFPANLLGKVARVYQGRCYGPPADRVNGVRFEMMKQFLRDKGMRIGAEVLLPERWAAARAGVTTFGKNTFAYADGIGSFIVIRPIVVDMEMEYDEPTLESKCPDNCTACIDACPSRALYAPFSLDPRRCLAFNAWKTTKAQGYGITDSIPRPMRELMGKHVHGCDICQEACPRNKARVNAKLPADAFLEEIAKDFSLVDLLHLSEEFYRTRVQPIMYNYIRERRFFQRNAAVALGNTGDPVYLDDLAMELSHPDEVVREHVAWAIGRIGGGKAMDILRKHLDGERSELVREEIGLAL